MLESDYCTSAYTGEALLQLARAIGIPLIWSDDNGMWMYSAEDAWEAAAWIYSQTEEEYIDDLLGVLRVDVGENEPL